jgi:hypothetical protein
MRNALCLTMLALAFAVPVAAEREAQPRRRGAWRQHEDAGPKDVAALAVTAIGASSLVFATRDGFVATGVRLVRGGLAPWTVSW